MDDEGARFSVMDAAQGKEVKLSMESLWLTGRILPVGARLVVVHTFRSAETQPMEVVYAFGLPRDAALRRFRITGPGFEVRSELQPVAKAVEAYERGVDEGHLSSLARVYRDGRVNLSVGNLRPGEWVKVFLEMVAGVELRSRGLRLRFPFTLAPCYHDQARAAETEPGVGELELPEEGFGDILLPRYLEDPGSLHQVGFDLSVAFPGRVREVSSPSHALSVSGAGTAQVRIGLARESDVPNRDLVLDVRSSEPMPSCFGGVGSGGRSYFAAVVPPESFGQPKVRDRSVVFVLDRSGSMEGVVLEQAKKAIRACLGVLSVNDRFALVAFDDDCETMAGGGRGPTLLPAGAKEREQAHRFLAGIQAGGGTRLGQGIREAARLLPDGAGDLFVVTDGQVGAGEDILALARKQGVRIHCLGIGAASQDRFLELLARATGGVSRFLTPRERVDTEAIELFASSGAPCATQVRAEIEGLAEGELLVPPQDQVRESRPLVVFGQASGTGRGLLRVRWGEGQPEQQLSVPLVLEPNQDAEILRCLQGARLITDFESKLQGEPSLARIPARENRRILTKLEELGRRYGLANRAMALVAVVERPGDNPDLLPKTRVVPVGMPEDTAFEAYFARRGRVSPDSGLTHLSVNASSGAGRRYRSSRGGPDLAGFLSGTVLGATRRGLSEVCASGHHPEPHLAEELSDRTLPASADPDSFLVGSAALLEPDGGVGGADEAERLLRSTALLLCFLSRGNTFHSGSFRLHVQRLVGFLEAQLAQLSELRSRPFVERLIARARADQPLPVEPLFRVGAQYVPCSPADHREAWDHLLALKF